MRKQRNIEAYTDGSCVPNPGIGGWGWVMYEKPTKYVILNPFTPLRWVDSGGSNISTNNEMELIAMAEFLEFCPLGVKANIWSDSQYVLAGIIGKDNKTLTRVNVNPQGWLRGWLHPEKVYKVGTKNTKDYWRNDVLKNSDSWYRIHQSLLKHTINGSILNFCWAKGHSGVEGNDKADQLANEYRKSMRKI